MVCDLNSKQFISITFSGSSITCVSCILVGWHFWRRNAVPKCGGAWFTTLIWRWINMVLSRNVSVIALPEWGLVRCRNGVIANMSGRCLGLWWTMVWVKRCSSNSLVLNRSRLSTDQSDFIKDPRWKLQIWNWASMRMTLIWFLTQCRPCSGSRGNRQLDVWTTSPSVMGPGLVCNQLPYSPYPPPTSMPSAMTMTTWN